MATGYCALNQNLPGALRVRNPCRSIPRPEPLFNASRRNFLHESVADIWIELYHVLVDESPLCFMSFSASKFGHISCTVWLV